MELRHLRYFVAVAEELHFRRAAERLHIDPSPLSQQIRSLESQLGVKLFARTKRWVRLTEVGRLFLEEARRTLSAAERAVLVTQRASRGEVGELRIGFIPAAEIAILPRVLPPFLKRFPDVHLTLQSLTGASQLKALRDRRIDIGLLRLPVPEQMLVVEVILREPLVLVLPENHRLATNARIHPRSLSGEPFILFPREISPGFHDLIVAFARQAGFSLHPSRETDHLQTTLSLVSAGLGVSLVPSSAQTVRRPGVAYRRLAMPVPHVETCAAWRGDTESFVLVSFLTTMRETLRVRRGRWRASDGSVGY